jgi:hypothetical protein
LQAFAIAAIVQPAAFLRIRGIAEMIGQRALKSSFDQQKVALSPAAG